MVRRSVALVIALVVGLAPSVLLACELACASADAAAALHACHETTSEPADTTVVAALHVCGHVATLPTAKAEQTAGPTPAPLAVLSTVLLPFAAAGDNHPRVAHAPPRSPDRVSLTTPLRI